MATLLRAVTSILLSTLLTACDRNAPAPSAEPSTEPPAAAQAAPPPLLVPRKAFYRQPRKSPPPRLSALTANAPSPSSPPGWRAERLCHPDRRSARG